VPGTVGDSEACGKGEAHVLEAEEEGYKEDRYTDHVGSPVEGPAQASREEPQEDRTREGPGSPEESRKDRVRSEERRVGKECV